MGKGAGSIPARLTDHLSIFREFDALVGAFRCMLISKITRGQLHKEVNFMSWKDRTYKRTSDVGSQR